MALLWIEGFEGYGTTLGAISSSIVEARGYSHADSSTYLSAGRMSGYGLYPNAANTLSLITTPSLTSNATLIAGCAIYFTVNDRTAAINFYYNGTLGVNVVFNPAASSSIAAKLGGTTLETFSGFQTQINTNVWYYLELKSFCHPTEGTIEVRLNGTTIISLTGINTQTGAESYYNMVNLSGSYHCRFDDFYVCDGTGATCNDFQGVCRVVGLFPNADTSTVQWTPSAGTTHYNLVDENPPNTADYVYSGTQAKTDLYSYPSLTGDATIIGIQVNTQTNLSSGTSVIIESPIVSNGVTDIGPNTQVLSAGYSDARHISMANPDTDAAWTVADLAAAQIGIKVM
jgi:hypothetical protein